jgi:hypothetical protein
VEQTCKTFHVDTIPRCPYLRATGSTELESEGVAIMPLHEVFRTPVVAARQSGAVITAVVRVSLLALVSWLGVGPFDRIRVAGISAQMSARTIARVCTLRTCHCRPRYGR